MLNPLFLNLGKTHAPRRDAASHPTIAYND